MFGEGEWAAVKHGGCGKRGWKKLHLGVDRSGAIVAQALTEPTIDDATTGTHTRFLERVNGAVASVTGDTAYDTVGFYEAGRARDARVVVPPAKAASLKCRGHRSKARDRTIGRIQILGRRRWKKASGYHRQARVENAMFRYKSIIGPGTANTVGRRSTDRGRPRLQHLESNDEPRSASVPPARSLMGGKRGSRRVGHRITQQRRISGW